MLKSTLKKLAKAVAKELHDFNTPTAQSAPGLNETYLFDFKNFSSGYGGATIGGTFIGVPAKDGQAPQRIKVKPIDVLKELEVVPTPWSLMGLDEKITILKDKEKLIVQDWSRREVAALVLRLENRKKYAEHKEFFESFQNTTDEKIEALTTKYDLVLNASDIFIPEFPNVAIKIMKEYIKKTADVCEKKPIFYVIATSDCFQKQLKRRDPILLVQSPFGFYWQILGAWDKEMLLLSEL